MTLHPIRVLTLLLFLIVSGAMLCAQSYEVHTRTKARGNTLEIKVSMRSATDEAREIRAVNFSVAFDSLCAEFKSYTSPLAKSWTTYLERSGVLAAKEPLQYGDHTFNSRWIFGTAQMMNTQKVVLPAQTEKPIPILTIEFSKTCSTSLYLEDEQEFPVNQMGNAELKPAPWKIIR